MIKRFSPGLLDSNTYLVYSEKTKNAMTVDCGYPNVTELIDFVSANSLTVKYTVLTHGHYDHAEYALEYLHAFPDAPLVCHEDEARVLADPEGNLSAYFDRPKPYRAASMTVKDGSVLTLADDMEFTVIHTPGHTAGSICLLCEAQKILFTGDTLFQNSYGRLDFKYAEPQLMRSSLEKLLRLDPEITFYPGHGESEKLGNW